ncbi:SLATT domain-containing protein [Alcanivorax sp. IO_7]|nr:SLATT domain-containing protein [Alcanivorax sp. IO_7]
MDFEAKNKFTELNRRVKLTSKARYNASRRLTLKNMLSQWTLALLSVALILISLVSASKLRIGFDQGYVDIMQIVFAVLILAYSLLLATGDYSARSVKIHRCGMELGRLARKVRPFEGVEDEDKNTKFLQRIL